MDDSEQTVNQRLVKRAKKSAQKLTDRLSPERLASVKDARLRQDLQELADSARAVSDSEGREAFIGSATTAISLIYGISNQHASEGDGKCTGNCIDGYIGCLEALSEVALGEDVKLDPDQDKLEVETKDGSIELDISDYDAEQSESPNEDDDPMTYTEANEALRDKFGGAAPFAILANCGLNYGICLADCLVPG